jgi:hypothetical protein
MTKRRKTADHGEAFSQLRRKLAKQYKRKADDQAIVRLAQYQLQETLMIGRQLAGEIITAAEFEAVARLADQAREAIAPATTERLTVTFVDGSDVCCRCGGENLCQKCGGRKSPRRNERSLERAEARAKQTAPERSDRQSVVPSPAATAGPAKAVPAAPKFANIHDAAQHAGMSVNDHGSAYSGGSQGGNFDKCLGGTVDRR